MLELTDLLTMGNVFRLLLMVILFGYAGYSFLLMMRVRILAETLKTERSGFVSLLAKLHFFMVIVGCVIVGILVLL